MSDYRRRVDEERRALHAIPISPTVSLGNLWSMGVTVIGSVVSLLVFAWWLSGYLQGFRDSIERVQTTVGNIETAQQVARDVAFSLDKRLLPLELDYAAAGARRAAYDARFAKIEEMANGAQRQGESVFSKELEAERKLEQQNTSEESKIQALSDKYYSLYKDLAGFKCRVVPKDCSRDDKAP